MAGKVFSILEVHNFINIDWCANFALLPNYTKRSQTWQPYMRSINDCIRNRIYIGWIVFQSTYWKYHSAHSLDKSWHRKHKMYCSLDMISFYTIPSALCHKLTWLNLERIIYMVYSIPLLNKVSVKLNGFTLFLPDKWWICYLTTLVLLSTTDCGLKNSKQCIHFSDIETKTIIPYIV